MVMNNAHFTIDGDLTAVPSNDNQLRALGAAIGKVAPPVHWYNMPANDNLPDVVAFTGLAGSGKSTATKYLVERHGYTLVKFAGPLKDMCRAVGLTEEQVEGGQKETPTRLLQGKSPRQFMQLLGTDFGRDLIGKDFWIFLWEHAALKVLDAGGRVVVDDCRFPNEASAIRKLGGDIFKVAGRGGLAGDHASERMDFLADSIIVNDGEIEDLHDKVDEALRRYG